MSRADKQRHQEHVVGTSRDTSVRLFAFANTRPRYHVVFAPEEPLIILKTKKSATPQHPCLQWEPLSMTVFAARPNTTHAVYVADTTSLSSIATYEQEEHVNGAAVGPLLKRLSNTLTRLNPHNATVVAAGVSAHLALKYVLVGEKTLGHRDRLVQRLVLVCPTPLRAMTALTNAVARRPAVAGYPLPDLVVLLKDPAEVPAWSAWLSGLRDTHQRIASFTITTDFTPSLFSAVAREAGLAAADGTTVDVQQRYAVPRVYRLDFVLSKQTKSVEQLPRLSPLDTLGYDDDDADDEKVVAEEEDSEGDDDDHHHGHSHSHGHGHGHADADESGEDADANDATAGGDEGACGSCCSCDGDAHHHHGGEGGHNDADECGATGSVLVSGLHGLGHWCGPVRVVVEGRIMDFATGLVGTTDGCVQVPNLSEVITGDATLAAWHARAASTSDSKAKAPAPAVAVAAVLARDDEGCTTLLAEEVRPLTKAEVRHSMTAGSSLEEIPVGYNASRVAHSYGALLIRGRKCALVRNPENAMDPHMRLPVAPHSSTEESCVDCAVRALCDGCEVSSDNFYVPGYLPPVVYYPSTDSEQAPRCVTMYTALAVCPPPRGAVSDAAEDTPEPEEPYDWVSFDRALTLLETEAEREAVRDAQRHLTRAHAAGLYTPVKGCGLFGDAVRPLHGAAAPEAAAMTGIPAPRAASRPASLAGVEFYVVACPGGTAASLVDPLKQALGTSVSLVCDTETVTTDMIEAAGASARQRGERHVLLFLGEDADAEALCENHLLNITERTEATAQVFTVLLSSVADAIADLSAAAGGGDDGDDAVEVAEAKLEALLSAVRLSDALVTVTPPEQLSCGAWAVLQTCHRANPDLLFFHGWEARRPFTVADADTMAAPAAATAPRLQELTVRMPPGVPVAPAALAYLTQAGSLDCFYVAGACRLLFAQGDVWVPTRRSVQGFVYLDVTSHCLAVEPGEEWAGPSNADRPSTLSLLVWCADEAAAADAAARVATMQAQLQWSETRDGSKWSSAHDPLPKWE